MLSWEERGFLCVSVCERESVTDRQNEIDFFRAPSPRSGVELHPLSSRSIKPYAQLRFNMFMNKLPFDVGKRQVSKSACFSFSEPQQEAFLKPIRMQSAMLLGFLHFEEVAYLGVEIRKWIG